MGGDGGGNEKSSKVPRLLDRTQPSTSGRLLKSLGCFSTEGEPNGGVICTTPADAEETPEVGVNREDLKALVMSVLRAVTLSRRV